MFPEKISSSLLIIFFLVLPAMPVFAGLDGIFAPAAIVAAPSVSSISASRQEVTGTISGIKGSIITVFANNTSYTVDASKSRITSSGKSIGISDLKKGDSVVILGQINGTSIAALLIFTNTVEKTVEGDAFIGTVEAISTSTFTWQPQDSGPATQTVNITSATIFERNSAPITFSDLSAGQTVIVTGNIGQNNPDLIQANKVEIAISYVPQEQAVAKGVIAPSAQNPSFFSRMFKAMGSFFAKIFSWL